MDSALFKYKNEIKPSETTKDDRKNKNPEESKPQYHFQGKSAISQHCFDNDTD